MRLAAPPWLALIALALILLALWMVRRRWQRFPFPDAGRLPRTRSWAISWSTLAGVMVAASLVPSRWRWPARRRCCSRRLERAEGVDLVIGLDVSGSMAALDFQPSDRLGVAKDVIGSFIAQRVNDRIGLVVFAGAAVTLCPLTLDHDVVQHLLDQVELETLPDGTAIGLGLGTSVNRLRTSAASSKVVVLVTDGLQQHRAARPVDRRRSGVGSAHRGPHGAGRPRRDGADPGARAGPADWPHPAAGRRGRGRRQPRAPSRDLAQDRRQLV